MPSLLKLFILLALLLALLAWLSPARGEQVFSPHFDHATWRANTDHTTGYCLKGRRPWEGPWRTAGCVTGRETTIMTWEQAGRPGIDRWEFCLVAVSVSGKASPCSLSSHLFHVPPVSVVTGEAEPTLVITDGVYYGAMQAPALKRLVAGMPPYRDRSYEFTVIPDGWDNELFFAVSNDEKTLTTFPYFEFSVNRAVEVCIARDTRLPLATWMAGYADSGQALRSTDPSALLLLHCRTYPAGQIQLGATEGVSQSSSNVVLVK